MEEEDEVGDDAGDEVNDMGDAVGFVDDALELVERLQLEDEEQRGGVTGVCPGRVGDALEGGGVGRSRGIRGSTGRGGERGWMAPVGVLTCLERIRVSL